MKQLKKAVEAAGGTLESDGVGGFEMVAPEGFVWSDLEVNCQPIPLSEMDSKQEKAEAIAQALKWAKQGVDKA